MGTFIVSGRDHAGQAAAYEVEANDQHQARAEAASLLAKIDSVAPAGDSAMSSLEDLGTGAITSLSESLRNEPTPEGAHVHKLGEKPELTPQELFQRAKSMGDIFRITALVAAVLLIAAYFIYFFLVHFGFERSEATSPESLPPSIFNLEVYEQNVRSRNIWLFWLILVGVIGIASLCVSIWSRLNQNRAQRLHDEIEQSNFEEPFEAAGEVA
jgi:hypothetical protein